MRTYDEVAEPFRSDREFWVSVGSSADALLTLVVATALTLVLGPVAVLTFAVPALLLVRATVAGRASARRSRQAFDNPRDWREAERAAVAAVFARMLVRSRRQPLPS